jgi:hypothetical protein
MSSWRQPGTRQTLREQTSPFQTLDRKIVMVKETVYQCQDLVDFVVGNRSGVETTDSFPQHPDFWQTSSVATLTKDAMDDILHENNLEDSVQLEVPAHLPRIYANRIVDSITTHLAEQQQVGRAGIPLARN